MAEISKNRIKISSYRKSSKPQKDTHKKGESRFPSPTLLGAGTKGNSQPAKRLLQAPLADFMFVNDIIAKRTAQPVTRNECAAIEFSWLENPTN